jgi:uncharacterized Ntn-hydrolase superfamily protein
MKQFQLLLALLVATTSMAQVYKKEQPLAHTYSIVARDSITGEMAVGVQSHWFSVGTAVTWAESGVGVVATQSFVDKSYGPKALALIKQGFTANQALATLTKQDSGQAVRQVAIIDFKGNVASHTGSNCIQYASHINGSNFSVQSNMMLGNQVCENMAAAFLQSAGKPLAERVLAALDAAEKAGGDIRGKQSAALLMVHGTTKPSWNDKAIDLRVDDHQLPLKELRRLYNIQQAYEHMNNGDLAVERNDMNLAMKEYNAAMKMFPNNLEMQYWTAIALANKADMKKALPLFKKIFKADKNWKALTKRLKPVGLLTLTDAQLQQILAL